jgi:hypothetical protein
MRPNDIVHELLIAGGTVLSTLVGDRVYNPQVPPDFANDAPTIALHRAGGTSEHAHPQYETTYWVKCFGGTNSHEEANQVYEALQSCLQRQSTTGLPTASGVVMSCREEITGQDLFDPGSGWPYVLSLWRFKTRPRN